MSADRRVVSTWRLQLERRAGRGADPRRVIRRWQVKRDDLQAQLDRLVEQIGCSLLRAEQLSIGWNSSRGVRGP